MNKNDMLSEIKRTAATNGGSSFGQERFAKETGVRKSDWYGKYRARWSGALREAGFELNALKTAYDEEFLIEKYIVHGNSGDSRLRVSYA